MEQILYILIGWFLGLFGPVISHKIKTSHSKKLLFEAIRVELHDLQYRLLTQCYLLRGYGTIDKDFLRWVKLIANNYKGNEPKDPTIEKINVFLNTSDEGFEYLIEHNRVPPGVLRRLKTYSTVFLESNLTLITELPEDLQIKIHECRNRLNILNQEIIAVDNKALMTYDASLSSENHALISSEIREDYVFISNQIKFVIDKIGLLEEATLDSNWFFEYSQIIFHKIYKKIKTI